MRYPPSFTAPAIGLAVAALLAAAPGCQRNEEGVRLPTEVEPIVITTPIAGPGATARPGADSPSPGAAPRASSSAAALTGATAAHRRSTLSAKLGGTVLEVHVREGDRVKGGDTLVTFDTRDADLRLKAANAAIAAARVQVDTAKLEADRAARLFADKAVTERNSDLAAAQLRAARAMLQQAYVNKEMAEASLTDAIVTAPFDAVVIKRHANEGETVLTMPPGPLVTLEEIGRVDVRVDVPASRMADLAVGARVRVSIPALGRTLEAEVARFIPTFNPMTRMATAVIELDDPEGALMPGLFAEITALAPRPAAPPATRPTEPAAEVSP